MTNQKLRFAAITYLIIGIFACSLAGHVAAQQHQGDLGADKNTIVLLKPDENGDLADKKNGIKAVVKGADVMDDPRFGKVFHFGEAAGSGIMIPDGGKFDFSRGITLEMWLQLQGQNSKSPHLDGTLFAKPGSFWVSMKNGKISPAWLIFPTVSVATSTEKQYKYYPLDATGFDGNANIPVGRWVHVAVTYDPVTRAIRTWVDGKLDVELYYVERDIPGFASGVLPLMNNPENELRVAYDLKNVRVADIRVSSIARTIEPLPPFETYVQALPYRQESAVTIDNIDPEQLPLTVILKSENSELQRFLLTNNHKKVIIFKSPVVSGLYSLIIKAISNHTEVYSRQLNVFAGDGSKDAVRFDESNRLLINGKLLFPLMVYHAFIEDVPALAKLGFNMFTPRYPNSASMDMSPIDVKSILLAKQYLEAAKASGIYAVMPGGIFTGGGNNISINELGIRTLTDTAGLALWYGADEPGKKRLKELQPGYTIAKEISHRPILVVTNMTFHIAKTTEVADIVGVDPYPIPNVSLRSVADHTRYAVNASGGLKPVFTVLPQYGGKQPSVDELRCMAYLAIVSGANGLGIYAWDDRQAITQKGWYTKGNPEDFKVLQTVMSELSSLQDIFLIPNSTRNISVAPKNQALHVALKEGGTSRYLMVVNDSRAEQEATLTIESLQSSDGENIRNSVDKLSIRGGRVSLQLPPLGAKLYRLSNIRASHQ